LDRKLGGPKRRSERCGEKKCLAMPGFEPGQFRTPWNKLLYETQLLAWIVKTFSELYELRRLIAIFTGITN
jgi:hypothetical protein